MDEVTRAPTLGALMSGGGNLLVAHAAPILVLCALGVGFDALLTYVGGFITFGYGAPFFGLLSTILQEVLYFGPAVLLWNHVRAQRELGEGAPPVGALDGKVFAVLFGGFSNSRAWSVAMWVTTLYVGLGSLLVCGFLVLGGILIVLVPGTLPIVKLVGHTLLGPVFGLGYLATAVAVARPERTGMDAMLTSAKLMVSRPLVVGLVLSLGGALEEAAGLTVLLGVALDAFLLCYCTVLLRSMFENGEITE